MDLDLDNRAQVKVIDTLPVSQKKLWDYLENNPGWHADIQSDEINGDERTYFLKGGKLIREKRVTNPQEFELVYEFLESPYPFKEYKASLRIEPIDDDECEVQWISSFIPDGIPMEEAEKMIEQIHKDGLFRLYDQFEEE